MSLVSKQFIFLQNVALLVQYAAVKGWVVTGGELYRSKEQQTIYLQNGQTKTKYSRHQERLAIDLNLFINGVYQTSTAAYQELGKFWVSLHQDNVWGGDWNKNGRMDDESFQDGNHFEMKP